MISQLKNKFKKIGIRRVSGRAKSAISLSIVFVLGFLFSILLNNVTSKNSSILTSDTISSRQLRKALKNKDFTLVNVHTPYDGEIAETDLFLEHDLIRTNKDKLPKELNAKIVLYCRSGSMSRDALETLKSLGYTNVSHLEGGMNDWKKTGYETLDLSNIPNLVAPEEGIALPINWGNIGPELTKLGVIDNLKFVELMDLTDEQNEILTKGKDEPIVISSENSHFVVNMLWAFGLAQKSKVYDEGPMGTEYKDDAGNFASTGGWSLAKGDAVNFLNRYDLVSLSEKDQQKVFDIANNVYRPCCGNSTAFPDCNHGMAALGAIELMVASGVSEKEIYKNLLTLNSYWFSDTYFTVATHFARRGISWENVDAKLALSKEYSSAQGAGILYDEVGTLPFRPLSGGGSCGA